MRHRLPGARLHALLVRLHPSRFRRRFGPASERLFADWVGEAADDAERRHRARRAIAQALGTLLGAWLDEIRRRTGALGRAAATGLERAARGAAAAVRSARRRPVQAATVVLTVAIAVGANAALFTIARTLLLRPLPYRDAGRLVRVEGGPVVQFASDGFELKELFTTLPGLAASSHFIAGGSANLSGAAETTRVRLAQVATDFFDVLGAQIALGRGLTADDRGKQVAVIGHDLWRSSFGGDPGVLGRSLTLNGRSYTIVGVAGPEVDLPAGSSAWLPAPFTVDFFGNAFRAEAIARLAPGADPAVLNRLLADRFTSAGEAGDRADGVPVPELAPLRKVLLRDVSAPLFTLLAAALLVLLLGGLNVATLWASEAAERIDDLRLRRALGASRRRILTDLVAEKVAVALAGGAAAILVAGLVTDLLASRIPASIPGRDAIGVDGATGLAALGLALVAGLTFGTIAAASALRIERGATSRSRDTAPNQRLQTAFVIGQGALALVLVAGAGLMVRTFQELAATPLGFDPEGTLAFQVRLSETDATTELARAYARELEERLHALPGVVAVGVTDLPPLSFEMGYAVRLRRSGDSDAEPAFALAMKANDDYFAAAGIPVLGGETFADVPEREPGLIVDSEVASRLFPDGQAVGRAVEVLESVDGQERWRETRIRAVVGRVHAHGVRQSAYPTAYYDLRSRPSHSLGIILRVEGNPSRLAESVREAALAVRPTVAPYNLRSLRSVASGLLDTDRVLAQVGAAFSLVAIGLAALGLYGLMTRRIARRRHEYGVRMALGAQAGALVRSAVRSAATLGLLALGLGLPGALLAARLLRARLYGIGPFDPLVLGAGCALLLAVMIASAWLPSRRITRVDPREALVG